MRKENKKEQSKLMKFISIAAIIIGALWMISDGISGAEMSTGTSQVSE